MRSVFPKNINNVGRIIRLVIAVIILSLALWIASWLLVLIALFVLFESLMSWCAVKHLLGKKSCNRPLSKLRVRRFSGLFWPIFDFFCGDSIRNKIQSPQKESKTRLKRTRQSTEPSFERGLKSKCKR